MNRIISLLCIVIVLSISALATGRTDSIPPFQYDSGVRARLAGDALDGDCDIRMAPEPVHPIGTNLFYYSTDGQITWNNVAAINTGADNWTASTPGAAGDAYWRFYFETDSCWGGQTPVYPGTDICRLPANWYVYWEDDAGLDSSNSIPGDGSWLDIRGAGFCVSNGRFYGKIVKANSDWRKHDGGFSSILQLYDHNYGYMFAINNPLEPTGDVSYTMVYCDSLDPPEVGGSPPVEFAPGVMKVFESTSEIYVIDRDIEFVFVAETLFMSCPITSIVNDADYGTYPNDGRYWNVQVLTMHLFWTGNWWDPTIVQYFADRTKNGHAYYNHRAAGITPWMSSPTAPNTAPLLTTPTADYNESDDSTTVTVIYTDTDENPPEYVRVDIAETRATYELAKAEVVGTFGWVEGITYSARIPGYHGWGADFSFSASDGVETYTLPAGPLYTGERLPQEIGFKVWPNPFNSACRIEAPAGAEIEIFDVNGRLVEKMGGAAFESGARIWSPGNRVTTGVYLIKMTDGNSIKTVRTIYLK